MIITIYISRTIPETGKRAVRVMAKGNKRGSAEKMAKGSGNGKPTSKELTLDILAVTLMDALALVGVISVIPYAKDDLVGAIAAMLMFAVLGVAYSGVVERS